MGTNSTRLLIADLTRDGLVDVERIENVTGLGRGVDRSGRLSSEAIERTTHVLSSYADLIRKAEVSAARAVATSAARDASNGDQLVKKAGRALGFPPEIIGGEEEASLIFTGATGRFADPDGTLVVDVGGGSTEIVVGEGGVSTDIGSIRLTERCLPTHPATAADLTAARREAVRVMSGADLPNRRRGVGTAGTWTSLAALHTGLDSYDPDAVEGTVLSLDTLRKLVTWLASLTLEEKQALPALDPRRAPIILGGAIVAETSLRLLGLDRITVTGHDILDGVCLSLAGGVSVAVCTPVR